MYETLWNQTVTQWLGAYLLLSHIRGTLGVGVFELIKLLWMRPLCHGADPSNLTNCSDRLYPGLISTNPFVPLASLSRTPIASDPTIRCCRRNPSTDKCCDVVVIAHVFCLFCLFWWATMPPHPLAGENTTGRLYNKKEGNMQAANMYSHPWYWEQRGPWHRLVPCTRP